ncbi:MAG: 2-oxoacid:acceptor oxidoreductase subunit alpha, partial [Dehalococcoidia bacterium]|nr:2-oxoacid:acceptor oxidoreductase subunit alpha [Dehalococcoidia bacterium]
MQNKDFVVRFAGEGGGGLVTSAELLAQVTAQVGYHVKTFVTFPSQIMGGPTFAQARISTEPVLSYGDELDVLVAFDRAAYNTHQSEVRDGGVIIYNSEDFQLEEDGKSFGLRIDELAKSTGNPRAANMVILGAIAFLVNMPEHYLPEFVTKRFSRGRPGDEEIIKGNIMALSLGSEEAKKSGFSLGELEDPQPPEGEQLMIKGNDAVALGAIAAGLDVFIGYPISPATAVLVYMERNLIGPGKFVYQSSSEIESIISIVGAGYAGKKAMTSTSGPGVCLMSEGIGMAWMAEIPAVILDVQRGGPATGLPTKVEQSDLLTAIHPAHGDVSVPIIAVGTVEECFYGAALALNWAERYQGPVILLSDHALSEQAQNIPKPDLSKVVDERRITYQGQNGYERYAGSELSAMPIPGGPGAYVANGSEHDAMGDTTHLSSRHIEMTDRRFGKLKLLEDDAYERENPEEPIALMTWGGSKGSTRDAYNQMMAQGQRIGWYYTMQLNPLPPKLLQELKQKELVLIPELNYLGQLSSLLRAKGVKAESITQYTGTPFKVSDLKAEITDRMQAQK